MQSRIPPALLNNGEVTILGGEIVLVPDSATNNGRANVNQTFYQSNDQFLMFNFENLGF